jgi:DNA-binding transcriptional regulator YiaG
VTHHVSSDVRQHLRRYNTFLRSMWWAAEIRKYPRFVQDLVLPELTSDELVRRFEEWLSLGEPDGIITLDGVTTGRLQSREPNTTSISCPQCGSSNFYSGTTEHEVYIGDGGVVFSHRIGASVPALICLHCETALISYKDLVEFDLRAVQKLDRPEALTGAVFRFMRKALGLRLSDLSDRIGVSADSAHAWETGHAIPDPAAFKNLVRLATERLDVMATEGTTETTEDDGC